MTATKFTRAEVKSMWALAVVNSKVFKIKKSTDVRVLAVRAEAPSLVPTKHNPIHGHPVNTGDWTLLPLDASNRPLLSLANGHPISIYRDPSGNLVHFDVAHEAVLTKSLLYEEWVLTNEAFLNDYLVTDTDILLGRGIVAAKPKEFFALRLAEEVEIPTACASTVTGKHWLVAKKVNPMTLQITEYDFDIVDEYEARHSYRLAGPATPSTK